MYVYISYDIYIHTYIYMIEIEIERERERERERDITRKWVRNSSLVKKRESCNKVEHGQETA